MTNVHLELIIESKYVVDLYNGTGQRCEFTIKYYYSSQPICFFYLHFILGAFNQILLFKRDSKYVQENGAKYSHAEHSVLARFRNSSFGRYDNKYVIGDQCFRNTSYFVHINVQIPDVSFPIMQQVLFPLYQMLLYIAVWEFICCHSPQHMKGLVFRLFYFIKAFFLLSYPYSLGKKFLIFRCQYILPASAREQGNVLVSYSGPFTRSEHLEREKGLV